MSTKIDRLVLCSYSINARSEFDNGSLLAFSRSQRSTNRLSVLI